MRRPDCKINERKISLKMSFRQNLSKWRRLLIWGFIKKIKKYKFMNIKYLSLKIKWPDLKSKINLHNLKTNNFKTNSKRKSKKNQIRSIINPKEILTHLKTCSIDPILFHSLQQTEFHKLGNTTKQL